MGIGGGSAYTGYREYDENGDPLRGDESAPDDADSSGAEGQGDAENVSDG